MTDRDDAHHDERQEARDPDHAPTRRERLYGDRAPDADDPWPDVPHAIPRRPLDLPADPPF